MSCGDDPVVTIGDPRARWGSCSAAGRIRYSWRLVLAPEALALVRSVKRALDPHDLMNPGALELGLCPHVETPA